MRTTGMTLLMIASAAGAAGAQNPLPPVPVLGRRVVFEPLRPGVLLRGELLGARGDSAWILDARTQRVVAVHVTEMRAASIQRHGMTAHRGVLWGLVVGAVSGIGLAAACSQVDDASCAGVVPVSTLVGLAFGGLAALSLAPSSQWRLQPATAERLAPYARFPQGPPPGMADSLSVPRMSAGPAADSLAVPVAGGPPRP